MWLGNLDYQYHHNVESKQATFCRTYNLKVHIVVGYETPLIPLTKFHMLSAHPRS